MELLHPPRPLDVPAELTRPTRRFKTHAWLAVLALVLFIATYFALTYWFGWTAYRLGRDGFVTGSFWGVAKAVPAAFVFAFLFRGLFAVKHTPNPLAVEIRPEDEPNLFAFLHRIADEAGAPRPHRVFLSPDVNAGVFYDLSLLNLFFPSKKNLVVGLGLVNVLDLHEMRAVMAHEFGHFAQKSMAVGRWVYIAEQIAGSIVAARTGFDKVLDFIANIDLRVAWIGWIMKVFVWSIRAVLDTVFLVVVLARQALSREMELQADLVAVSLTGSDALVHALHKLHAADEAYGNAAGLAQSQLARGKQIVDLYAAQTRMLETIREITSDATYGVAPPLPERDRERHRVFPDGFAQPPKMWSTHPPSREREENAKRVYIPCKHDPRPAWVLFGDPARRRGEMTAHLLGLMAGQNPLPEERLDPAQVDDVIEESYGKTYLDRRYRGLYLGRGVTRNAEDVRQLYRDDVEHARLASPPSIEALYPEEVAHELERWRSLEEEHVLLNALHDGFLEAPGGVVRYRGKEVRRRDLKKVIDEVDAERKAALARVVARDREVRTAHRLAARAIGGGWEDYLTSLAAIVHYAEHTEGDIRDADGHFQNVFQIVIADGRVSNAERKRLVAAAHEAYEAVARPFWQKGDVHLPEPILKRLGIESWSARLGDFGLGTPTEENIPDWLQAADSWLLSVPNDFADLRAVALEVLVDTEEHVARCARGECEAGEAPAPAWLPQPYRTLVPGNERERQKKLDLWDRFQLADGFFPAVARLGVALAVLGVGFFLGGAAMVRSVVVYNGLGVYVDVDVDGERTSLRPSGSVELPLASDEV
ncbi:MAG: M48 family metalloprotease, partial [Myxococcales bacterium]|nr:M48 family metalloprotease [Myxococcales bacterium]